MKRRIKSSVFWSCLLFLVLFTPMLVKAQNPITTVFQPGAAAGQDAIVHEIPAVPARANTNMGNYASLADAAWTWSGDFGRIRGLLRFDLACIPTNAVIQSATLTLFNDPTSGMNSGNHAGANASWLQAITANWAENTVTWNNQPATTAVGQVAIPQTAGANVDVTVNVTGLVTNMIQNPATNFGFMLRLQTEQTYRTMVFGSSDNANAARHPRLVVSYTVPGTELGVNAGSDVMSCGTPVTLTGTGAITYSWTDGNGFLFDGNPAIVNPTVPTTYTVSSLFCGQVVSTDQVTVTPNQITDLGIETQPFYCAGDPLSFVGTGNNVDDHVWEIIESNSAGVPLTTVPIITQNFTGNPGAFTFPGNFQCGTFYRVRLLANNECGQQISSVVINMRCLPDVDAGPDVSYCGSPVTLTATGTNSYSWSLLNGTVIGTGASITVAPSTTTTYVVTGTGKACSNTDTVVVTPGSVNVNAGADQITCGAPATLTATGADNYTWTLNGVTIGTGPSITVDPDTVQVYIVTGTSGSCVDSDTVVVIPNPITVNKMQSLGTRPTSSAYTFQNVNYEIKICNSTNSDQTVSVTDDLPATFVFDQIVYGAGATDPSFMPTITAGTFTGSITVPANGCISIFYTGKYQTFGSEQTACIPQEPNVVVVTDPVCGGTVTDQTDLCISFGCPGHLSISTCDCEAPINSDPDVTMWYNQHKLYEDVTRIEYIVHYPEFLAPIAPVAGLNNQYDAHFAAGVSNAAFNSIVTNTTISRYVSVSAPSPSSPGYNKSTVIAEFAPTDIGTSVPSVFNIKFNIVQPINNLPTNSYALHVESPVTNAPSYTLLTTTTTGNYEVLTQIAVLQLTGSCWDTLVPDSDFTYTVDNCTGTVTCTATNTESGFHRWEFNDPNQPFVPIWGSETISNTYLTPGTYNINHMFVDQNGISSTTTHQVTVTDISLTKVKFKFAYGADCVVNFKSGVSVSAGSTVIAWSWDFGDPASGANNYSNLQYPQHYFNGTGAYNVCLTVTVVNGEDTCDFTICNPVKIKCPCEVHASFKYKTQDCTTQFAGTAVSPYGTIISYSWNFGNPASGVNNTSNLQNPTHTFTQSDAYNVCLTVTSVNGKDTCTDTYCQKIAVECPKCELKADFKYSVGEKCEAKFGGFAYTGLGTSILSWSWDFGDAASGASNTSNLQDPVHYFSATGTYNVCLTVTAVAGADTCKTQICYKVEVVCPKCEVTPKFDYINEKCTTYFNDFSMASGTIIGWSWNFGDPASGVNNTSNLQNPSHVFTTTGSYKVCLIVTAVVGNETCKYEICQDVKGGCPCKLNADFKYVAKKCKVSFGDLSSTPGTITSWSWNFGNPASGTNNTSTAQNPTHVFTSSGTYTVCLTVSSKENGIDCSYTVCKTVSVNCATIAGPTDPMQVAVMEAFPNPTVQEANVRLMPAVNGSAHVAVYNMYGEMIGTLYRGTVEANVSLELKWNASNVTPGVYIIKADLGTEVLQERIVVTK